MMGTTERDKMTLTEPQTQEAIDQASEEFTHRINALVSAILISAGGTNTLTRKQQMRIGDEVWSVAKDFPASVLDLKLSGSKLVLRKVRAALRDRTPERAKVLRPYLKHKKLKAARTKKRKIVHPE